MVTIAERVNIIRAAETLNDDAEVQMRELDRHGFGTLASMLRVEARVRARRLRGHHDAARTLPMIAERIAGEMGLADPSPNLMACVRIARSSESSEVERLAALLAVQRRDVRLAELLREEAFARRFSLIQDCRKAKGKITLHLRQLAAG